MTSRRGIIAGLFLATTFLPACDSGAESGDGGDIFEDNAALLVCPDRDVMIDLFGEMLDVFRAADRLEDVGYVISVNEVEMTPRVDGARALIQDTFLDLQAQPEFDTCTLS